MGAVQLFTHHFHRNCQTNNLRRVFRVQPGHLFPDRQHPVRLAGKDHMITVVPGLPAQSALTPVAPRPRTSWSSHLWNATRWVTC